MTREEAIKVVKAYRDKLTNSVSNQLDGDIEALEMAIQALENHDTFMKYAYSYGKADALSQEPTEKLMTVDEMEREYEKSKALFHKIVECDDAISREELLKAIDTWDKFGCDADTKLVRFQDHYVPYIHYDDVIKCIKGMPSVTQKSGKWIAVTNGRGGHECSLCHEYAPSYQDGDEWLTKYCPNCGAKMVEPQESEE